MKTNLPTIEQVLSSPSTSKWLKASLIAALDRDPVDAANDAELLAAVLGAFVVSVLHG